MGALLQRMGLQGTPSQSLVQAPSADLIVSDNELILPEPEEIKCELTAEELEQYLVVSKKLIGLNNALGKERLWHDLHSKGFRNYSASKVNAFMANQISHIARKRAIAPDTWWSWIDIQNYKHPIPPQIIKKIESIDYDKKVVFISDIVSVTSRRNLPVNKDTEINIYNSCQIIDKRSTEICFLRIKLHENAGPKEQLTIDAWRGPTFSDGEAKI